MKIVIIGASFSGVHCALKAKELHPYDEIILVEQEDEVGYLPSGLTLLLNGKLSSLEEAKFTSNEKLIKQGIHLMTGVKVTDFDFSNKSVTTTQGELLYDRLVLAMGSSQYSQKFMSEYPGLLTYKKKADAKNALEKIEGSQEVAIIGAGQAGMELASALVKSGRKVILIESMDYPLYKSFDKELLAPLVQHLEDHELVETAFSQTVKKVIYHESKQGVNLMTQQGEIHCGVALLASNVRPNLSIFKQHLAYHTDQTLKVDAYFETSQPGVFAIGDLIQVPSLLLNQTIYLPLINNAVRSGNVCAENLKKKQTKYMGSIRIIGTHIFGYYLAGCGLTEADSFLYEEEVASLTLRVPVTIVENEMVTIKFIYNKKTEVLLGVQIISKANILEKINTYALAIDLKMTIRELAQKDYFYHPSYTNSIVGQSYLSLRGINNEL